MSDSRRVGRHDIILRRVKGHMAKPVAVTDATFEEEVLEANQPVLVDFWAEWCAPCLAIAPMVEELAEEYDGLLKVVKLNADDNPNTMQAYGILGIPTLILFKDGEPVERLMGFMPKESLLSHLKPHMDAVVG
jgi:thioredoxin 1